MKIKFLKANNGDSILISFSDEKGINRNILIDGGTGPTYYKSSTRKYGDLYDTIENLKTEKQKIDLLVLTHIDDDHIGGILSWLAKDKEAYNWIDKVWFNSGKTIADFLKAEENKDLHIELNIFKDTFTSIPQSTTFEQYIETHKLWDQKIILNSEETLKQFGVEIQILSPNKKKLEKLLKEYKKDKDYFTGAEENDWNTPISDFIKEETQANFKFDEDSSVPNGSSIAFILTYKNKKYMFLGDSHPSVIIESLKKKYAEPIEVELLKVSHHGSCYNTNKELLNLIKTDKYVLSSDSTIHNLPNKRTLARIIKQNPNAILYFNYENLIDNIFSVTDRSQYPTVKLQPISTYKDE